MNFILKFFQSLPYNIEYAIERGLDEVAISSSGDLDILIRKRDFPALIQAARDANILTSLSISYSGARIFLGDCNGIKRIDFNWIAHYRGLPLGSVEKYLQARRKDSVTGLFVLPDKQHAAFIYLIKNSYGGAEKYRQLLEENNFMVLNKRQRHWLIFTAIIRHPLASIAGKIRYTASYLFRFIYPTGLLVSGLSRQQLENNHDVMYLFQNRISSKRGLKAFLDTRLLSRLCITPDIRRADIALNGGADNRETTTAIVKYLRSTRTRIPALLFKLA